VPSGRLARVEVLEVAQVAPGDDEVHPAVVLDVEVAHGGAAVVDDAKAQGGRRPATQLGLLDRPGGGRARRRPGRGPGAARHPRHRRARRGLGVRGRRVALGRRADRGPGQRAAAQQRGQHRREGQQPDGDAHRATT
jgi:hypothetical protein